MIVDLRNELLQDMITLNRNIDIVIRRLTPPVPPRPITTIYALSGGPITTIYTLFGGPNGGRCGHSHAQ